MKMIIPGLVIAGIMYAYIPDVRTFVDRNIATTLKYLNTEHSNTRNILSETGCIRSNTIYDITDLVESQNHKVLDVYNLRINPAYVPNTEEVDLTSLCQAVPYFCSSYKEMYIEKTLKKVYQCYAKVVSNQGDINVGYSYVKKNNKQYIMVGVLPF
jgi:hypothetical protein